MIISKLNNLKEKILNKYYKITKKRVFNSIKKDEDNEEGYKLLEEILDSIKKTD